MYVRQAIVLVGGKGARLQALTRETPKPLLEIEPGLRFLDVVLLELSRHGFTDIILLAGHLGDIVKQSYQGRTIHQASVRVICEPEPQGTGGALRFAANELEPWFLMLNGDSLFEVNLRELARAPSDRFDARLALRQVADPARYGTVTVRGELVTAFAEKTSGGDGPGLINGGLYLTSRRVLALIGGPCSIERDVFPALAAGGRLQGRRFEGYFLDIGLPDTYEQARREVPGRIVRPCAFLDLDSVLNRNDGNNQPRNPVWMPGSHQGIRLLNEAGYYVTIFSNRAGASEGQDKEKAVRLLQRSCNEALAEGGAHIDAFYDRAYDIDHATELHGRFHHPDRKTDLSVIAEMMQDYPIAKDASFLIGSRHSDIAAAEAADIRWVRPSGAALDALVQQLITKCLPHAGP